MHVAAKAGCRIFQTCFYLAIPFLPYREPERYRSLAEVAPLLQRRGIQSVLLVTDPGLRKAGATAPLEAMLAEGGIHCAVYDQTTMWRQPRRCTMRKTASASLPSAAVPPWTAPRLPVRGSPIPTEPWAR